MSSIPVAALQFVCDSGHPWSPVCLWQQMSWFERGIIIVLAAMMLRVMYVTLDRTSHYFVARRQTKDFLRNGGAAWREREVEQVLAAAKKFPRSHVAVVIASGIDAYLAAARAPWRMSAAKLGWHAADRTRKLIYAELAVGRNSLANIGAVAMYVGIGGTVVAILNTHPVGDMSSGQGVFASGYAAALLMTVLGMFVAIPAMIGFNYLQGKLQTLAMETSNACSELLTYLKAQPAPAPPIEAAEAEWLSPSLERTSGAPTWEVAFDRQRMVLVPLWAFWAWIVSFVAPAFLRALLELFLRRDAGQLSVMKPSDFGWSFWPFFLQMEWLSRGVVIILAFMVVHMAWVMVDRLLRYHAARRATEKFVSESATFRRDFDLEGILKAAKRHRHSHIASITASAVDAFQHAAASPWRSHAPEFGWRAAERCRKYVHAELAVGLYSLLTIAGIATFIGIGGTVVGILDSFGGSGSLWSVIAAIANGLAESLVTTLMGLFIAIAALVGFNCLRAAFETLDAECSVTSSELLALFQHHHQAFAPSGAAELLRVDDAHGITVPKQEAAYERQPAILFPVWTYGVLLLLTWMLRWW